MSGYVLIRADPLGTLVRDDPIVRSADVSVLRDAAGLLAAATALQDNVRRVRDEATEQGREDGFAAGHAEGLALGAAEICDELLRLTVADADRVAAQRADLARLGLEVVRRIAADLGPAEMAAALADKAASAIAPDIPLVVRVAPAAVARTRERLGARATIEPDESLGAEDCVLATPLGEVRAGLDTQLGQLARQWGVE